MKYQGQQDPSNISPRVPVNASTETKESDTKTGVSRKRGESLPEGKGTRGTKKRHHHESMEGGWMGRKVTRPEETVPSDRRGGK